MPFSGNILPRTYSRFFAERESVKAYHVRFCEMKLLTKTLENVIFFYGLTEHCQILSHVLNEFLDKVQISNLISFLFALHYVSITIV